MHSRMAERISILREGETLIGIDAAAKIIVEHYGLKHQEIQAVQELSELILLLAARDDQRGEDYKHRLTEEIADSFIMIEQIRAAHNISDTDIIEEIERKITRQFARIEKEAET